MGIDCMREDRSPNNLKPGKWTWVSVCDTCRLYASNQDCPSSYPCPRCGSPLRYTSGYWERLSPKWMFWKNYGRWRVKEGEEAKRVGL